MKAIIVVENPSRWPLQLEGAELVAARDYLVGPAWAGRRKLRVYNLCRTYSYQTVGYYVSLLAAARGHRAFPPVETLQDVRLKSVVRLVSEQLEERIQRSLAPLKADRFDLSIYFGRNLAKRYDSLARSIHEQFPLPLLRATFERHAKTWTLITVGPIATNDIPDNHRPFVIAQAEAHFGRRSRSAPAKPAYRYDLAILTDPEAVDSPSTPKTLQRFIKAARDLSIDARLIGLDAAPDIGEFDALFIRQTTYVDHPTYRLSRRAETEGLVVIDDPISILRCTNKVFLAELFSRNDIPHPATLVAHVDNVNAISDSVGLPCVLKKPDSAFSRGVIRVDTEAELETRVREFLKDSDLVVAQRYTPSDFDWRIGVLGDKPLFACRYHMARGHWQIVATGSTGQRRYGRVESVPLDQVPAEAIRVATKAARLIGDGLYGVDIKETKDQFYVIEINDNPNIDIGYEDAAIGHLLYTTVMDWFRHKLELRSPNGEIQNE